MKLLKEFGRDPHIDWATILLITFFVVLGLAFSGYSLYNAVVKGTIKATTSSKTTSFTKVNEKMIEKVITDFEHKKEKSDQARIRYTGVSDPSF